MDMREYERCLQGFVGACSLEVERVTRILCIVRKAGRDKFCQLCQNVRGGLHAEQVFLESIARGAFEATGCEIVLFSNHSPCGECSDRLRQFMSTAQRVTLSVKFTQLYRTHGSNTDEDAKRTNRNGLKKLYDTANVKLSVMTSDDWLALQRPICNNPTLHFGVIRIRPFVEPMSFAVHNMERNVSEIKRATHLIQSWCGQHQNVDRQTLVIRRASMEMRQHAIFIDHVVTILFSTIKDTRFANVVLEEFRSMGAVSQRVGVLRNNIFNTYLMYTVSAPGCGLTTETGLLFRNTIDLVSYLSEIMNNSNGESLRSVMYPLVEMNNRYENMLMRQNINASRLEEIVAGE